MRKVLSLVLVLTLVLGSVAMAFAVPADVKGEKFEDAVNALIDLKVVEGYPDGNYKPEKVVTRAEMAALIIRAMGLEDYAISSATPFNDVPKSHWASGYISYAFTLGIINGRSATVFDPDSTVSYDEAIKMLVASLGYTLDALIGTYPGAYVSKAQALGILEGVQAGTAGANRGDIATLLYQTLDQNMGKVNKDGEWIVERDAANNPITMATRLGAEEMFAGAPHFGLLTPAIADTAKVNVRDLVGAWVRAYQNKDGDLLGVKEIKTEFLTGKMTANDKFKADGKTYILSAAAQGVMRVGVDKVTYKNGAADGATNIALNTEYTIAAEVSGSTIKEVRSTALWVATRARVFEEGDARDITNKKLLGAAFAKDDDGEIDTKKFALFGVDKLGDIKKGNVVAVYGDPIARIEVGTQVVSGKVTMVKDGAYTIDGKEYEVSGLVGFKAMGPVAVKSEYDFTLDYDGDVYDWEKVEGAKPQIAFVVDAANGTGVGLNDKNAVVKLLLADGTSKLFTVENGVVVTNGGGATAPLTLKNAVDTGVLVEYTLNDDNEIDGLKIFVGASFVQKNAVEKLTKNGDFDGEVVSKDVVIFTGEFDGNLGGGNDYKPTLPRSTDVDDYGTSTLEKLLDTSINGAEYILDDNEIIAMFISESADSAQDEDYAMFLAFGEIGTNDYVLDLLINGEKKQNLPSSKKLDSVGNALDPLKLYEISYGSAGKINKLVDKSATVNNVLKTGDTGTNTYVFKVKNGRQVYEEDTVIATGVKVDTFKFNMAPNVVVYVLDGAKYKVGSVSDIFDATVELNWYDTTSTPDGIADIVLVE